MNCCTSSYAPRFLAVAAIAVLVVALSGVPVHAQILCTTTMTGCPLTFVGASTTTGQSFNAPAPIVTETGLLQLTHNLQSGSQDGAAWSNMQQQIAGGFGVEFQFQVFPGSSPGGDGFAFVIQNSSLAAIGGWGGGMGYGTHETDTASNCEPPNTTAAPATAADTSTFPCAAIMSEDLGIPNSVAIEFDTYQNFYDPPANHVAIQSCGIAANSPDHESSCLIANSGSLPINLANGSLHYVQIVYLPYSLKCPRTETSCPNLSVYIDPASNPVAVVQAHVDLNNPCNTGSQTPSGCPSGTILTAGGAAWVGFTGATGGAEEEADIVNFTFTPSVTHTLQGSGATNSFVFPFATYNVTYPADVPITGTTMTITPTLLPGTLPTDDCNARLSVAFPAPNNPTCTTFGAPAGGDAAIFDVACAVGTNQTQGDTNPAGLACPVTSGFNPLNPPGNGNFHTSEDVSNILIFGGAISSSVAPQFLTASEGTNGWVPIGVGFDSDCCSKGGGTSNYQSQMVAADFPGGNSSPFAVQYQFIGFTSPVNPPVINSAQAGQTIPFKWELLYPNAPTLGFNGGPVTNLSLVTNGAPTTYPFLTLGVTGDCLVSQANLAFDERVPVDTESQNGLVNQGNGFYQYNWQTPKTFDGMALAGQCLVVTADVGDGQMHNADIQFHK